jgi:magnesium transporter
VADIEKDLEKSTRNEELHKMLRMEKCLVYFMTSLKSNDILIAKLRNSRMIKTFEVDEDLLEDVIIENRQAIEMANIYSDIQSGMMDAFASVISNNLNVVMKQLAVITIILMIPTFIASMYGMNVPNNFENNPYGFLWILLISFAVAVFGVLLFRKKNWF